MACSVVSAVVASAISFRANAFGLAAVARACMYAVSSCAPMFGKSG